MNNIRREREDNPSYQRRNGGRRQEGRDDERSFRANDDDRYARDRHDEERGQEDWRTRDQYESSIAREDFTGSVDRHDDRRYRFSAQEDLNQRGGAGGRQSGGYYDSSQSYQAGQGRFSGERYYGQGGFDDDEQRGWRTGQGNNRQQTGYGPQGQGYQGGQSYGRDHGAGGQSAGQRDSHAQERYGQERYGRGYGQPSFGQDDFGSSQMGYADQEYRQRAFGETGRFEAQGRGFAQRMKEFIGKGPKGYTRSDERIKEEVSERLSHGYLDASDISVSVAQGEVTLEGTVRSKDARRVAEDVIENILGVKDVDNRLKVQREPGASVSSGQSVSGTPPHKRS